MFVRTRFAPSPTGYLHVGGVRTALFSWLYARHHNGNFILRIEDTDKQRSTQESVDAIIDGLKWLGIDYDEGPFFQSKRFTRYSEIANKLLQEDKAYRCYCTKERLEKLRESQLQAKEKPRYDGYCRDKNLDLPNMPFVVRFKNPKEGRVTFNDDVYGEISVLNEELDDLILIRSDNTPTYNFTVVIDDADMQITHVIRGDDHINNTPRQINLFKAMDAIVPKFAHLPMILGADGKRLSKRHGAVSVLEFKEQGFLPHAVLNYLARLGWSYKDKEIFSVNELIEYFNLNNVSRAAASFNIDKLTWLNQHYQKADPPQEVANALNWYFQKAGINIENGPSLEKLVSIQADRCKTLIEICEKSRFFYEDIKYDDDLLKNHLSTETKQALGHLYSLLEKLDTWESNNIQECINNTMLEFNLNMRKVAQPLRIAVTGGTTSPSIDMTLELLGKHKTLHRIGEFIKY